MKPVEVTTVEVAGATPRPRPPAVETLRKIPSFNHQHSLLVLHNDVKTRSQAQEQQLSSGAKLCLCSIQMLILGMALTNIGCAVWSIVLYMDVKETKCAKVENILFGFGALTLMNVASSMLMACIRNKPEHDNDKHWHHKAGESGVAMIAFMYLCYGFAVVTGNPPRKWGDGATNRERCDPDGDVWPQMTIMFILAFSVSMAATCFFCCAVGVAVAGRQPDVKADPAEPKSAAPTSDSAAASAVDEAYA